jgi:hypothetical protein
MPNEEDVFFAAVTKWCEAIHGEVGAAGGDKWAKRIAVARSCGYMDAKHMVFMMETNGFPIWAYIDHMNEKLHLKLAIPWEMLEHELICIGKKPGTIRSLFQEMGKP